MSPVLLLVLPAAATEIRPRTSDGELVTSDGYGAASVSDDIPASMPASAPDGDFERVWTIAWVRDAGSGVAALAAARRPEEAEDARAFMIQPVATDRVLYDDALKRAPEGSADVLGGARAPKTCLRRPGPSIWGRHRSGRQPPFAYTSACAADDLDLATVEVFNLGTPDARCDAVATSTVTWHRGLRVDSGSDCTLNDDGSIYDAHDWAVIDLPCAETPRQACRADEPMELGACITGFTSTFDPANLRRRS